MKDSGKEQTDKSNDFIRRIYEIILSAGAKGIEYRKIIEALSLRGEEKQKFESYMLSHYCRKLVNYGMIIVSSKLVNKSFNVRTAKCREFNQLNNDEVCEFIGKRKQSELSDLDVNRFNYN